MGYYVDCYMGCCVGYYRGCCVGYYIHRLLCGRLLLCRFVNCAVCLSRKLGLDVGLATQVTSLVFLLVALFFLLDITAVHFISYISNIWSISVNDAHLTSGQQAQQANKHLVWIRVPLLSPFWVRSFTILSFTHFEFHHFEFHMRQSPGQCHVASYWPTPNAKWDDPLFRPYFFLSS